MHQKKIRKTGSFIAVDDAGKEYAIDEWTDFDGFGDIGDPQIQWEEGLRAFKLGNVHVNDLGDGVFEVAGLKLRKQS